MIRRGAAVPVFRVGDRIRNLRGVHGTRRAAQVIIEAWRKHHNAVRPDSSLDYLTLYEFKQHHPPIHDHPTRAIPQE